MASAAPGKAAGDRAKLLGAFGEAKYNGATAKTWTMLNDRKPRTWLFDSGTIGELHTPRATVGLAGADRAGLGRHG